MPSAFGEKLNRVYRATIAPGEIGTAFLAIRLYSNPGNPICVDGVHFGVIAASAADAALISFQTCRLVRGVQFQEGVAFGVTLGQPGLFPEEYFADVAAGASGENVDFQQPIELEAGYLYTFLHEGPVVTAGPVANVTYFALVRGRTVPTDYQEKLPVVLRSGITDALPEGCVQVEG